MSETKEFVISREVSINELPLRIREKIGISDDNPLPKISGAEKRKISREYAEKRFGNKFKNAGGQKA